MKLRLPALLTSYVLLCNLLTGCAFSKSDPVTNYDLGTPTIASQKLFFKANSSSVVPAPPRPLTVAAVTAAPWLDSQMMHYRLSYSNDQQPKPYASSRWNMTPTQLLSERIKIRLAQTGNVILTSTDGAINIPLLRIEADDFSQRFASPAQSDVHVAVRASLFNGRTLIAQQTFEQTRNASPDAAGGARALAEATDLMINDMAMWLATFPTRF